MFRKTRIRKTESRKKTFRDRDKLRDRPERERRLENLPRLEQRHPRRVEAEQEAGGEQVPERCRDEREAESRNRESESGNRIDAD